MAWPKDNSKPLAPVKSRLMSGIDSGFGGTVAGAVGTGATLPARAGAAAVSTIAKKAPVTQVVGGIANRLMADASGRVANANANVVRHADGRPQAMANFAAPATQLPDRKREVRGKLQADGSRMVIDQRPVPQAANPSVAPTANPAARLMNAPPAQTVYEQDQQGRVVPVQRPGRAQQADATPARPQVDQLNGTRRAGNMDVTFDADVPLAARQAFMKDPVKPEGQIIQYNNRQIAEADRQEFNRSKLMATPELLTRENSPEVGWQERNTLNERNLINANELEKERMRGANNVETTLMSGENQLANTSLNNSGNLDNTRLQNSGQLANTSLNNEGEIAKVDRLAGHTAAQGLQTADQTRQAETQKRAYDLLDKGVPPETIQGLMNTQPGQTPDVSGVQVPQNTEPKVGRYKDRPIFNPDGDQVGTRTFDTATGQDSSAGEYQPDPKVYNDWQSRISKVREKQDRPAEKDLLMQLWKENPELYEYMRMLDQAQQ